MSKKPMALYIRVAPARWARKAGAGVTWGEKGRGFRQTVWFSSRAEADTFAAGIREGREAHALILELWGAHAPMTAADLGRLGAAAYLKNTPFAERQKAAKRAIKSRWKKYRIVSEQIRALLAEQDGRDLRMTAICERALGELDAARVEQYSQPAEVRDILKMSVAAARAECARVIDEAKAAAS